MFVRKTKEVGSGAVAALCNILWGKTCYWMSSTETRSWQCFLGWSVRGQLGTASTGQQNSCGRFKQDSGSFAEWLALGLMGFKFCRNQHASTFKTSMVVLFLNPSHKRPAVFSKKPRPGPGGERSRLPEADSGTLSIRLSLYGCIQFDPWWWQGFSYQDPRSTEDPVQKNIFLRDSWKRMWNPWFFWFARCAWRTVYFIQQVSWRMIEGLFSLANVIVGCPVPNWSHDAPFKILLD